MSVIDTSVIPFHARAWTTERIARLKELAAGNYSAAQIAAALGNGFTRNAIIGKCKRMEFQLGGSNVRRGDERRSSADSAPLKPRVRNRPTTQAARIAQTRANLFAAPVTPELPADQSDCAVPFHDHKEGMCLWPIGEPSDLNTFRFCGSPIAGALPYCGRHARIAYTVNKPLNISDAERARRVVQARINMAKTWGTP